MPRIEYHPMPASGVQNLMYVGDLDRTLGDDWSSKAPKLLVAGALLAILLHVALKR